VVVRGCSASTRCRCASSTTSARSRTPPEEPRRRWKVQRDCSRRGYTTDEELDRREADAETYIRPQARHADIVISFGGEDQDRLDAPLALRPDLVHRDLGDLAVLTGDGDDQHLRVPGSIGAERSAVIEETIRDRMRFASPLRTERLGELTVATELHRWESLAITQLLLRYQLVTARAAVTLGAADARVDRGHA
jgi:phosphoribulokinase